LWYRLGNELARGRVLVVLDSPEIRKLLKGSEVSSFLMELGESVASNAGPEYSVVLDNTSRKTRALVNVVDTRREAKFIEMKTGKLARALGATKK
jgi:hypothetical protein